MVIGACRVRGASARCDQIGLTRAIKPRSMRFVLFPKAYAKLIFHCSKYPHKELNGVLIGSISKKDNSVHVNDVIPLFHVNLALSPMLEVALAQVSSRDWTDYKTNRWYCDHVIFRCTSPL